MIQTDPEKYKRLFGGNDQSFVDSLSQVGHSTSNSPNFKKHQQCAG